MVKAAIENLARERTFMDASRVGITGALRLDANDKLQRVGGVEYTVKDGIVYNAKQLLGDIREMVAKDKAERGIPEGVLPMTGL